MIRNKAGETERLLYALNKKLEEIVEEKFEINHPLVTDKQSFVAFSFGKAYKTHKAILFLCDKGYGEDAAVVARSLFELGITTLYILSDKTDYLVNRYYDYDWIIRRDVYKYAINQKSFKELFKTRTASLKKGEDSIETIFKKADRAQDRYKYDKRRGWSDRPIRQMAGHVGRKSHYYSVYNLLSQVAHSAPRTINDFVEFKDGGFIVKTAPSFNWIQNVLVISFDYFHAISVEWSKEFDLGLGEKLESLAREWVTRVAKINEEAQKGG